MTCWLQGILQTITRSSNIEIKRFLSLESGNNCLTRTRTRNDNWISFLINSFRTIGFVCQFNSSTYHVASITSASILLHNKWIESNEYTVDEENEIYLDVEWCFLAFFVFRFSVFIYIVLAFGRNEKSDCTRTVRIRIYTHFIAVGVMWTVMMNISDVKIRFTLCNRTMREEKKKENHIFISDELLKNRNKRKLTA